MTEAIRSAINGNVSPDEAIDRLIANNEVQQFVGLMTNYLKANASTYQISQSRSQLGGNLYQYDGKRDIFKAAGYKGTLNFEDYMNFYRRNSISSRIIKAPPDATWREAPTIKDGGLGETLFTEQWKALVNFGQKPGMLNDQKTIWHYTHRGDILAGIGCYGALVIGVNDGKDLSEPLEDVSHRPASDLLYISSYDQANISVNEQETSFRSRRFGLPKSYNLSVIELPSSETKGKTEETTDIEVHWSRVVHIAEGLLNDEIFGTPRLEAVYNLLEDLIKVTAASGESAWQLMNKGLIASIRDGYTKPTGEAISATKDAMESFMNELQKVLQIQGADVTILGGEIVDPTGVIKSIISLVSAVTNIPQRILLGAEAGQLASSMDEINWANVIESRQVNFAEPIILRPLVNRFIHCGLLPPPQSGDFSFVWPSQLSLTDLEEAQLIAAQMGALAAAIGEDKLPVETFLREFLKWSDKQIERLYKARRNEIMVSLEDYTMRQ